MLLIRAGLFAAVFAALASGPVLAQQKPDLIVAISVDQFSADLFQQYRPHFTGGLARLSEQGVTFPAGYQSHGATETCPGHSTILTGSRPARTGIIANNWFDMGSERADRKIYCAEDERVAGSTSENYTVDSLHLKVPALGDHMKRANPASRVVVVSGKDRAAVMLGGYGPDQRWWWQGGRFASHAGVTAPAAVTAVNEAILTNLTRGAPARPLPGVCQPHSRAVQVQGAPLPVGEGRFARPPAASANDLRNSPDLDRFTIELADGLRREMRLGEGASTDLLILGLSANDYVGHFNGTQGAEMCIQILALDAALGGLFERLDATGLDYLVMLTADHGGYDIPERHREHGIPEALRVDPALFAPRMGEAIGKRLRLEGPVLFGEEAFGDIYIDRDLTAGQRRRVLREALRAYRAHPQVEAVFTREQIAAAAAPSGPPDEWPLIQRLKASFDAQRSGDFVVVLKPRVSHIWDTGRGYVAGHGSPWDYDRRVPILFWREGMTPFEQALTVETVDILPTLAGVIGVPIPAGSIDGRCLDLVDGPASSCPR